MRFIITCHCPSKDFVPSVSGDSFTDMLTPFSSVTKKSIDLFLQIADIFPALINYFFAGLGPLSGANRMPINAPAAIPANAPKIIFPRDMIVNLITVQSRLKFYILP